MKRTKSLLAALLLGAGCQNLQNGSFTPERAQLAARSAALAGASVFLIKKPAGRADLERVRVILTDLSERHVWDLQLVADALFQAGLKELRSAEAVIVVEASVGLIDAFSGNRIAIAEPVMAAAVIKGALDGVTAALARIPPPVPPAAGVMYFTGPTTLLIDKARFFSLLSSFPPVMAKTTEGWVLASSLLADPKTVSQDR